MKKHQQGQVTNHAAEIYEKFFVPALFGEWPPQVLEHGRVQESNHVLDIACGTGILARAAKQKVGLEGKVVGTDINEGMLAVARSISPEITWKFGSAESLPFEANSFDRVVSQFGLMFFQDKIKAISEMIRVTKPGGRICIAVWASLESTPGYAEVAKILHELFGSEIAKSIESPYSLGDPRFLLNLFHRSGANSPSLQTLNGKVRFSSIDSWIHTDIKGWTLSEIIDEKEFLRFKKEAESKLAKFVSQDGSVEFATQAHLVSFTVND